MTRKRKKPSKKLTGQTLIARKKQVAEDPDHKLDGRNKIIPRTTSHVKKIVNKEAWEYEAAENAKKNIEENKRLYPRDDQMKFKPGPDWKPTQVAKGKPVDTGKPDMSKMTIGLYRDLERIAGKVNKDNKLDEIAAETKKREEETGKAIFHWVYCHPLDKERIKLDYKKAKKKYAIIPSTDFEVLKPLVLAEEYFPHLSTTQEMADRYNEKYKAYMAEVERSKPRGKLEIRLPTPFESQKEILEDKSRFKVMVCGRRFGKTTLALVACVLQAVKRPGAIVYYIAPTYRQAKSIAWKTLLDWIGTAYKRKNEQELVIELPNGSRIELKGAENEDSLRGVSCDLVVLDEYGDVKPSVWGEIIRPTLADRGGKAIFIGTPKGFNHFHELWTDAFEGELGGQWKAWRLTTYHNPTIPREEIEAMKNDMEEREFEQEVLAKFVQFEGLVYQDFERHRHVKTFKLEEIYGTDICGLDWGADHPTAGIFVRHGTDGKFYVWAEHYLRDAAVADHSYRLKEKAKRGSVRQWFLDPSAKQIFEELKRNKIRAKKAVNDRSFGISEIRTLLRNDNLIIHASCSNLIYEFEHHRYKDKDKSRRSKGDVDKEVLKIDDDALDALRYAIASYKKGLNRKGTGYNRNDYFPTDLPRNTKIGFDFKNLDANKARRRRGAGRNKNNIAAEFRNI